MKYIPKEQKNIVRYDAESDVLYFGMRSGLEEEVIEIAEGVNAEIDKKGNVIGVEVLNASKILRPVAKSLKSKIFQVA